MTPAPDLRIITSDDGQPTTDAVTLPEALTQRALDVASEAQARVPAWASHGLGPALVLLGLGLLVRAVIVRRRALASLDPRVLALHAARRALAKGPSTSASRAAGLLALHAKHPGDELGRVAIALLARERHDAS